jgi:tripartite-type tricarboxylate transporter receptor subunit TctC
MRMNRLLVIAPAVFAAIVFLTAFAAFGQTYPSKPIALVSTAPAGGSIDAVARIVASELGTVLGKPVLVDPRSGAGGNIAAAFVAKADPDGYTLLITASSTLTVNPHIYKALPFDPEKSFAPIVSPAEQNLILVTHPRLNITSIPQLIALLKAQPGKLNYGSGGTGNLQHLAGEVFNYQTGTQANHIPYKGAAPALNDMLAGQLDYMFDSATAVPHIKAGKLHALGVVGPKRVDALPDLQTFRQLGIPGMEVVRGYYAILAPAGTPRELVQRLNQEMVKILQTTSNADRIKAIGLDPNSTTPEELAASLREDRARFGDVVKRANITAQ